MAIIHVIVGTGILMLLWTLDGYLYWMIGFFLVSASCMLFLLTCLAEPGVVFRDDRDVSTRFSRSSEEGTTTAIEMGHLDGTAAAPEDHETKPIGRNTPETSTSAEEELAMLRRNRRHKARLIAQHQWCVDCAFVPPRGAEHCDTCGVCIRSYDHHCPWTSKCIGQGNARWFYAWLASIAMSLGYLGVAAALIAAADQQQIM